LQDKCHPQTIAVTTSRADGLGLTVRVGDEAGFEFGSDVCGVLLQYPATDGSIHDYKARAPRARRRPERQPHASRRAARRPVAPRAPAPPAPRCGCCRRAFRLFVSRLSLPVVTRLSLLCL